MQMKGGNQRKRKRTDQRVKALPSRARFRTAESVASTRFLVRAPDFPAITEEMRGEEGYGFGGDGGLAASRRPPRAYIIESNWGTQIQFYLPAPRSRAISSLGCRETTFITWRHSSRSSRPLSLPSRWIRRSTVLAGNQELRAHPNSQIHPNFQIPASFWFGAKLKAFSFSGRLSLHPFSSV